LGSIFALFEYCRCRVDGFITLVGLALALALALAARPPSAKLLILFYLKILLILIFVISISQRPLSPVSNFNNGFERRRAHTSPSPPRRWTVNGAITRLNKQNYFYVDPAAENERTLLPGIRKGNYIMFYGARGSGKSTRIERVLEQLQDQFCCLR